MNVGATEKQSVTSLMRDLDEFRKWKGLTVTGENELAKKPRQSELHTEDWGLGGRYHDWDRTKEKAGIQAQTAKVQRFSGRGLREQVAKTLSCL